MDTLSSFAPMILGVVGGIAAMLLDAWGRRTASVACAALGLVAGGVAAAAAISGDSIYGAVGAGEVFSVLAAAILFIGACVLGASFRTLTGHRSGARIAALAAFAAAAAATVAASRDLGMLFLSVEALALCGYGLVALADTDRAREAAMKWFVQGSVSTALFIVGIAVLTSRTAGSLSYDALRTASGTGPQGPLAVGLVLVFAALAFKAGAFPFHSWMPDALQEAPAAAAAVLASAGKIAPLAAAAFLALAAPGATGRRALMAVALVSVGSIVFGNLAALRQRSLARMLAYSAIAQVGYAFAGVATGAGHVTAVFAFAILYGLTSAASFVFIVAMREREPGWDGTVSGLAGLSRRSPALAAALSVIMLSLTGIPLTAGFWGKYLVFGAASTGPYLWLTIVAVLGSVVSFGYYGRVIRTAYMDEAPEAGESGDERQRATKGFAAAGAVVLAVVIVLAGVFPLLR